MLKEAAAEFLGTFILIVFGIGVVAQTVLSKSASGSYLGINADNTLPGGDTDRGDVGLARGIGVVVGATRGADHDGRL